MKSIMKIRRAPNCTTPSSDYRKAMQGRELQRTEIVEVCYLKTDVEYLSVLRGGNKVKISSHTISYCHFCQEAVHL